MDRFIIEGDRPEDEVIILRINDPVKDLMEEMEECQENEQWQSKLEQLQVYHPAPEAE